ncbi:hypothetical protein JOD45_000251 [Scopulibacillus daqui]|uniref:Uncharacterized protein n=1 Tax=Scopulibacillus daqui TaxID=1469162 RepID=A0ABS2PVM2_9BACL|nr:hypothetical protein [Scopulibacillus daqui]
MIAALLGLFLVLITFILIICFILGLIHPKIVKTRD